MNTVSLSFHTCSVGFNALSAHRGFESCWAHHRTKGLWVLSSRRFAVCIRHSFFSPWSQGNHASSKPASSTVVVSRPLQQFTPQPKGQARPSQAAEDSVTRCRARRPWRSAAGWAVLSVADFQKAECGIPFPAAILERDLERSERNRGDRDRSNRSRSSSSTGASRTAAAGPFRVITTGPELPASSRKALNFALTSARLAILTAQTPDRRRTTGPDPSHRQRAPGLPGRQL